MAESGTGSRLSGLSNWKQENPWLSEMPPASFTAPLTAILILTQLDSVGELLLRTLSKHSHVHRHDLDLEVTPFEETLVLHADHSCRHSVTQTVLRGLWSAGTVQFYWAGDWVR